MFDQLQSYISWFQFVLIIGLLVLAFLFINRNQKQVLLVTKLPTLRVVYLVLLVMGCASFVLVNPLIHGLVVLVVLGLMYPLIVSFFKGIMITNNANIKKGDVIKIGEYKGKVDYISFSGIGVLSESHTLFIPFQYFAKHVLERFSIYHNRYVYASITADEGKTLHLSEIERILFDFPYLEPSFDIEIQQFDDACEVRITLANSAYLNSLVHLFAKHGYRFSSINQTQS